MKATSRPFKSKHSGRCAICKRVISEGELMVRLDKRTAWNEERASLGMYGKRYSVLRTSNYAHAQCLEEPIPLEEH